ncbi:MAG: flagellar basal-body MS-ring/collar protein FliF [bacterium]
MAEENLIIDDLEEDLNNLTQDKTSRLFHKKNIWMAAIIMTALIIGGLLFYVNLDNDDIGLEGNKGKNEAQSQTKKKTKRDKKIKYLVLYPQLPATQVSQVIKELSFANISFTLAQKGKNFSLSVDSKKLETAKVLLATKGLPSGAVKGYELLDNTQTLGVTEFDKKVRYLRALSGELEKVITSLEMIEDAKVQIVMPKERLFISKQPPVTASILVRKTPGKTLTTTMVYSIMQLVAKAVESLSLKNITVVDTQGTELSYGILDEIKNEQKIKVFEKDRLLDKKKEEKSDEIKELQPILPNFENIKQWFTIKENFENNILSKINKQLAGVFPRNSFKVAANAEITASKDGNSAEIKRTTVSIIVDEYNEDIVLDDAKKIEVFSTIAAIIGYQDGRDIIFLNKAPFYKDESKTIFEYFESWGVIGMLSMGLTLVYFFLKSRKKGSSSLNKKQNEVTKFEQLKEEIQKERNIDDLKKKATSNPEHIAAALEELLKEEVLT